MNLKYSFFLIALFLLISNIVHAGKPNKSDGLYPRIRKEVDDSDHPFQVKLNGYNAYLSVDDKWTATGQNDSEETAIKDPDKASSYFEAGVSKKY